MERHVRYHNPRSGENGELILIGPPNGMTEPEIDEATDMTPGSGGGGGGGGGGSGDITNISQLVNDVGYITAAQAPVQSVDSMTGDVVLPVLSNQDIENMLT